MTTKAGTPLKKPLQTKDITTKALAAIIDSSEDAIFAKTLDGIILNWNRGAERIYGYTAKEIVGKHVSILTVPDVSDEIPKILSRLAEGQSIQHYETIRKHKDGHSINVSLTISPIKDETGQVIAASTVARDITERVRLTQLRDFLASIVDSSRDAILSKDLDGFILSWNNAAQKLYGYTPEEIIGKHISILVPPDHPEEISEILFQLQKGQKIDHYETVRVTKHGTRIHISLTVSPIKNASGEIIAASAIARDITELKRDQEEKARLLKELESSLNQKNLLLQEVYHRVKNNLQVISSLLDLGSKYVKQDPERAAGAFKESIGRIRSMALVHEKLYKTGDFEKLNLSEYLQSLSEQLFLTYAVNKKIDFIFEGELVEVDLNTAIPLGLIFNELITNSLKHAFANSQSGTVRILCNIEKSMVRLNYSDSGSGLPESIDSSTSETFGFRLIKLLTKQVNGTIKFSRNDGISMEIPLPRAKSV